ncbi:uncharacterized protein [Physcomitrium patens]|nr:uncharacterized protein LOC112291746 isoform X1 [Physcomitrium patens]XP_024395365.1 uncharacterized protein LOC112291746 isoform X1 [Physcomitrium patens]|eukprot:XP_024395363.1 uncharacterized protein LOC112291746 isoform X1 [Physcomitrella patens]
MMADFDLMELAPEQEDLAYLHQQLFSTATEVVTGGAEEPTIVVQQTTATTVNIVHDGKYGNGNTAPEHKEDDMPVMVHGEGEALVGRSVVKKFRRTKYSGKVTAYDPECKWYKVSYEDGDEEELEYKELAQLLVEAGEAEAVKAANFRKRAAPEINSDSKSPAKKLKGRKPTVEKKPAKDNSQKETKSPKVSKSPRLSKKTTPKKMGNEKLNASETHLSKKKKVAEANTPKRGRGRPKKDTSLAIKPKVSGKGSGVRLSKSKLSTRKTTPVKGRGESKPGRPPRAKGAVSPALRKSLSLKEGVQLIGAKTKKKFDNVLYDGEVIGFDPKVGFYKIRYSDGDNEELTLKELKKTLVEDQATPKRRGRAKDAPSSAKAGGEPPKKKQKVSLPKKDSVKVQSRARVGTQPRKRGRPAKAKR